MAEKYILDVNIEKELRENYTPLDRQMNEKLSHYGKRILNIYEARERGILLDHLKGIYEMASGKEAGDNLPEAMGFLDNVLEQMETNRQAEEVLHRHQPSLGN